MNTLRSTLLVGPIDKSLIGIMSLGFDCRGDVITQFTYLKDVPRILNIMCLCKLTLNKDKTFYIINVIESSSNTITIINDVYDLSCTTGMNTLSLDTFAGTLIPNFTYAEVIFTLSMVNDHVHNKKKLLLSPSSANILGNIKNYSVYKSAIARKIELVASGIDI